MGNLSKRSKDALKGVHPKLVQLIEAAVIDSPIDFTVTEGLRTTARQQQLYAQGRTVKGVKVTNADGIKNKSNHQAKSDGFGHAVDLYPFVDGKVRVNEPYAINNLRTIANHIKAKAKILGVKVTWGGDWKSPFDPPHFQIETI